MSERSGQPAGAGGARAWGIADPGLAGVDAELVLVDDGSDDDTWPRMQTLQGQFPGLSAARHEWRQGIPAAWRTGLGCARGEILCLLDANLQYQPEDIPRLWEALGATGADIVQGVRAGAGRPRDARLLLSRGLSGVLNLLFGMSLRDNKSGSSCARARCWPICSRIAATTTCSPCPPTRSSGARPRRR